MNGRISKVIRKKLKHEYREALVDAYEYIMKGISESPLRTRIKIAVKILRKKDFSKEL